MGKMQNEFNEMKNDIKAGAQKVGNAVKHTAENLKEDAEGAMAAAEMKVDEMKEEYREKKFSKELKKQMEHESKNMKH